KLSHISKTEIENSNNRIIISVMVLLEIKYLHHKKRFKISPDIVIEHLENDSRCLFYPIDLEVVSELSTSLSIHDAVIVATAKVFEKFRSADGEVFILTKDKEITDSGIVKTIW
ncbi:MAG: type II toxin-antitoxin system VapC family toxin, partial [bacterium]